MERRYFEYVYSEICVCLGRRASRYDLWQRMWDSGADPDGLTVSEVKAFIEDGLDALLAEEGGSPSKRERRRLEKRLVRFDPENPTPEEWMSSDRISWLWAR